MAAGYDISASAASGLSHSDSFSNNSGISFGSSSTSGGDASARGGEVVSSASRQQQGGNQAVPDSSLPSGYGGSAVSVVSTNWLPWIIGGGVLVVGVILFFIIRKR